MQLTTSLASLDQAVAFTHKQLQEPSHCQQKGTLAKASFWEDEQHHSHKRRAHKSKHALHHFGQQQHLHCIAVSCKLTPAEWGQWQSGCTPMPALLPAALPGARHAVPPSACKHCAGHLLCTACLMMLYSFLAS